MDQTEQLDLVAGAAPDLTEADRQRMAHLRKFLVRLVLESSSGAPFGMRELAVLPDDAQVLLRTLAEYDRLRAMEQRARAKANAPRRLDGAASWDTASYILGESISR